MFFINLRGIFMFLLKNKLIILNVFVFCFFISGCATIDSDIYNDFIISTDVVHSQGAPLCEIVKVGPDDYRVYNVITGNSIGC